MMQAYLAASVYIDWQHDSIIKQAKKLATKYEAQTVNACFEFVRDKIKHSWDYQLNPVTCKASDVLAYGTGFCYAKSHLLAALLRANGITAGLCYQRLSIDNAGAPFCLHGLNAVFLKDYGWYRLDARGNKNDINALFCPPIEKLAFPIVLTGEADLPEIWAEPLTSVITVLEKYHDYAQVAENLPDIELITHLS